MLNLQNSDMITFFTRILEMMVGIIAIVNFRWQLRGNSRLNERQLLKEIEKQEREIARLKIEISVWKKHYHDATNSKHLHTI